ncbi:MAG: hypothetical protein ACREJD_02180 [Phycisphaerales bacterium]
MTTSPRIFTCFTLIALASTSGAFAQWRISTDHKFSWNPNAGWMNWLEASNGTQSVRLSGTFLSGKIWMENIGWLDVGDGTPAGGVAYSNASGLDFGVNHNSATGALTGFAWSENAGWVNFGGGALATPPNPARIQIVEPCRLRGFAWSENLGWINLDDSASYIQFNTCPADLNVDGQVDDNDFVLFAASYNILDCAAPEMPLICPADLNLDSFVNDSDFVVFANAYDNLTCP